MANVPGPVTSLWDEIVSRQIRISSEVWAAWHSAMDGPFNAIRALALRYPNDPVTLRDAGAINACVNSLVRSFKDMGRCDGGPSRVREGKILFDPLVKELMVHYVGNDLYKIALMADVYGEDPAPLSAEIRGKMVECLDGISVFIERLKSVT